MTTPRGFRDKSDESLLTLVGEIPELVRNLVIAEFNAVKKWIGDTSKNAGLGAVWVIAALFVLFWSIPVLGTVIISVLSLWLEVWASALIVFGVMIVAALVLAFIGYRRFRRIGKNNPVTSISEDVRAVKEAIE